MNKKDLFNVASTANGIMVLWRQVIQERAAQPTEHGKLWHKVATSQAYQDALNCMKFNELIEDYDVVNLRVKIKGSWYTAIRGIKV